MKNEEKCVSFVYGSPNTLPQNSFQNLFCRHLFIAPVAPVKARVKSIFRAAISVVQRHWVSGHLQVSKKRTMVQVGAGCKGLLSELIAVHRSS